ncbi:MAG: hypothetical protein CME43_14565 [Haliea sp.]|jgi:hypothetical protein|uniref:hypothetical protein n=1 Tax=Haliea sp. TaxID=1932666 RepID=UPI000C614BD3|nr:hypothetical protein [Haliea sp.]MBM70688.1 hypothetical protein [Haliea sp.]|tara:strand:- start:125491 stop:125817 length:327 start_codon:yes stop_codon:yes gene_type:complete
MKTLTSIGSSLALAAVILNPAVASAGPASDTPWMASAFGSAEATLEGATALSTQELEASTGRWAPLALALGIAGVDLALISVYWGIYLPTYGGGGSCAVCNNAKFNAH